MWQVYAMPKYFFNKIIGPGQILQLEGELEHHLKRVLRVRLGERVILCNGEALDFHCVIKSLEPLTIIVESYEESRTELPCKITLYQAMPKSDKLEWIIQKSVELGVHSIVPVYTEHSVVRHKSDHGHNAHSQNIKMARYQKIAEAAAGQSMRGIVPKVHLPMSWDNALEMTMAHKVDGGLIIAAHEKEQKQTIKTALNNKCYFSNNISSNINSSNTNPPKIPNEIGLWIGPEGGFSEKEVGVMEKLGVELISLGPRILRTETATIAALAQIILIIEEG